MDKTFPKIKLVLFDVGGVLIKENSDNHLVEVLDYLNELTYEFNQQNISVGILSIEEESISSEDLQNSKVNFVIESSINKEKSLNEFLDSQFDYREIFYIADDILDIPVLQKVGFSASPLSARREVKRIVDFIIRKDDPIEIINEVKRLVLENA